MMLDLLVIGAGLAGLSAAIVAAEAGLRVRVVTKGLSALHWAAGTIDLLGYLPPLVAGDDAGDATRVQHPLAALDQLPDAHPLRRLTPATVRTAHDRLQAWLADAGLPYAGGADATNLWLPSPAGAARPAYLAPAAQVAARLDDPAPLLIVGFDKLRDFYPHLIAENLTRQGHQARASCLPFSCLTLRHDANTVQLAQSLDDPAQVATLGTALRGLVQPGERVVLPAICGLTRHPAVLAALQELVGAPVAEIPTMPPSVAGIRLHHALVTRLQTLGGRVEVNMAVTGFTTQPASASTGQVITAVQTAASARPLQHRAVAYLLATGGILGGGISSDHQGRVWENALNLPLHYPDARPSWFRPQFLDPRGHPIFAGGVEVDANWQPIQGTGAPCYANLWAAGSILAHADTIRTRSREGLAVATGFAAATAILASRSHS